MQEGFINIFSDEPKRSQKGAEKGAKKELNNRKESSIRNFERKTNNDSGTAYGKT